MTWIYNGEGVQTLRLDHSSVNVYGPVLPRRPASAYRWVWWYADRVTGRLYGGYAKTATKARRLAEAGLREFLEVKK